MTTEQEKEAILYAEAMEKELMTIDEVEAAEREYMRRKRTAKEAKRYFDIMVCELYPEAVAYDSEGRCIV